MYICPICKQNLALNGKTFSCKNNHCFDVAKQGYVNLINVKEKHSLMPGDNAQMVNARRSFLQKGYYKRLADEVCDEIKLRCDAPTVIDAGCCDGYYLGEISKNIGGDFYGFDISKDAVKIASAAHKNALFAVASVSHMPYKDNSADVILRIFAPHNEKEYLRVLKTDGIFIQVTPGSEHLLQLKRLLYDEVYLNDEKSVLYGGLTKLSAKRVRYDFVTQSGEDNFNLLTMTPYFYKTPQKNIEKLKTTDGMTVTADFIVEIYAKKQ